ncbi:hypothetical protein [Streptomyces sp. NPDC020983]|uniref:hypothetical protein n=1 Tax=Streptomyces sp. NPDC020983 TaxID=3365106 RepID=UPI0037882205
MSSAGTSQENAAAAPAVPDPAASVLYVCTDAGTAVPGVAAQRAEEEGRAFAEAHGLTITELVADEYGEPDPCLRQGWQRVRELAAAGAVASVLVRWPTALAPDSAHEYRYRETRWLQDHGVRVLYTWAPLTSATGGAA